MTASTWYFSLLIFVVNGEQYHTTCNIVNKIRSTVESLNRSYHISKDIQLLTCLAGLHDFNSGYFLNHSNSIDDVSIVGIFGFNSDLLSYCTNITPLSLKDDDLSNDVACYLDMKNRFHFVVSSISEKLCSDIAKPPGSIFFNVKYESVKCQNRSIHIPSYRLKRLYRMYFHKGVTNELAITLNYENFSANVTYYDSYVYAHFFLEKWWRLLKKLKKSLIVLTKRPVRLFVALVIALFLLLTLMRCLKMAGKCFIDKLMRWKERVKEAGFLEIN